MDAKILKPFSDDIPTHCEGCDVLVFDGYTDEEDTIVLCEFCYTERYAPRLRNEIKKP